MDPTDPPDHRSRDIKAVLQSALDLTLLSGTRDSEPPSPEQLIRRFQSSLEDDARHEFEVAIAREIGSTLLTEPTTMSSDLLALMSGLLPDLYVPSGQRIELIANGNIAAARCLEAQSYDPLVPILQILTHLGATRPISFWSEVVEHIGARALPAALIGCGKHGLQHLVAFLEWLGPTEQLEPALVAALPALKRAAGSWEVLRTSFMQIIPVDRDSDELLAIISRALREWGQAGIESSSPANHAIRIADFRRTAAEVAQQLPQRERRVLVR
jgi:hypothetical protein